MTPAMDTLPEAPNHSAAPDPIIDAMGRLVKCIFGPDRVKVQGRLVGLLRKY